MAESPSCLSVDSRGAESPARPPCGLELTGRTIRVALLAILGVGLLVRLLHFAAIQGTAFPRIPLVFTTSDMHSFWEWARTIQAGDWLGRNTYHPAAWSEIAPLETWYRWWGGKEIFHQAPLYPYLVAVLLAVFWGSLSHVLLVQLVIGALQPLVMYRLGSRLFDGRVGVLAAGLAALYGPFIFFQGSLLRDWLPLLLEPLALVLLLRAGTSTRRRDWALAGAALGVALLAKETILLFLPLVLFWVLWERGRPSRKALVAVGCVLGGFLAAVSPLITRNALVGAPLFAISNRALEGFILGNAADTVPIGIWPRPSMKEIFSRADGRFSVVVLETLKTYHGDWRQFVRHQWLKLRGLVDPLEVPDNLAFAYGLEISPILRVMLGYGAIFPLGLAGCLFVFKGWRGHLLLLLYGLSTVGGLMVSIVLARYRLAIVPVLILYGAAGVLRWVEAVRARHVGPAIGYVGLVLGIAVLQHRVLPIPELWEGPSLSIRAQEYVFSAEIYASDGRPDRAAMEMERLRVATVTDLKGAELAAFASLVEGDYRAVWALKLLEQGKREEATREAEKAETLFQGHRDLSLTRYRLGVFYFHLNDPARAGVFLGQFLELEPQGVRADEVRRLLARLDGKSG